MEEGGEKRGENGGRRGREEEGEILYLKTPDQRPYLGSREWEEGGERGERNVERKEGRKEVRGGLTWFGFS